MKLKKSLSVLLLFALLINCAIAESPKKVENTVNNSVSYLKEYFGDFDEAKLNTAQGCNQLIEKITEKKDYVVQDKTFSMSFIKAIVEGSSFKELALTYTEKKAADRLKNSKVRYKKGQEALNYAACALDVGLISPRVLNDLFANKKISSSDMADILLQLAQYNGKGRNFIGYSNDSATIAKLLNIQNSSTLFESETLQKVGIELVKNKVITGYNLKDERANARFLKDLTIQYGHSEFKHALQLIGLLNSEDIVVKIAIEPKVSVYEYLLDWGPVPAPSPTYEVKKVSDNMYLAYAVEYDLLLEFNNKTDLKTFDSLIEKYAKKYEPNKKGEGLLFASWWQPLYSTTVNNNDEKYTEIVDCSIQEAGYSIHSFTTLAKFSEVKTGMEKLSNGLKVDSAKRFCNLAFYRYLTGSDYQ